MRIPRDWSGEELIKLLGKVGYMATRQSGSHVRLTRSSGAEEHHITVPLHKPVRLGTLNAIISDVAQHLGVSKGELLDRLR